MFERPIANLPPEPPPVPADRYPPLSTFHLGKGEEAQRAVYDSNDDIAKNPGREERKPDDLHCQRKGVVEQPHQDRKNETQEFLCGEHDKNKRDDYHIVEGTAEAAPRSMPGYDSRSRYDGSGLKTGIVPAQISTL